MGSSFSKAEARSRLARAEEFLTFARMAEGDPDFVNSVVSLCAQSTVAACDAVLLVFGETRGARAQHGDAATALRRIGQDPIARLLVRLLKLKPKAQYSAGESCTLADASNALSWATRVLILATDACDRRMKL